MSILKLKCDPTKQVKGTEMCPACFGLAVESVLSRVADVAVAMDMNKDEVVVLVNALSEICGNLVAIPAEEVSEESSRTIVTEAIGRLTEAKGSGKETIQ